jgi:hypothetical protein
MSSKVISGIRDRPDTERLVEEIRKLGEPKQRSVISSPTNPDRGTEHPFPRLRPTMANNAEQCNPQS